MKLLYDYDIFSRQRFGGISRYFFELISGISEYNEQYLDVFLGINNSGYDFSKFANKLNIEGKKVSGADKVHFLFNSINQWWFNRYIKTGKYDVFHQTYYSNETDSEDFKT